MSELYESDPIMIEESIEGWVITKCEDWRDYYESNYESRFEEYYRLWRGIWDPADSDRRSERSRIISPALQQAVESNVAELEEATFGRGKWFDVSDNMGDTERQDVQFLRNKLTEDFEDCMVRKAVAECLINAAVFGTGIGEIVIEEMKEMVPATQPIMDGDLQAVGINITDRVKVKLRPILPQNFLIDPVATSVDEALGVCIDEFVSKHHVEQLQEQGIYRDVYVGSAAPDTDLEPDQDITIYNDDKIRLTKYYGLVPRELLAEALDDDIEEEGKYVEAVIVVANGGILLKAEANPYMMQDRPVVAFPWDVVPGRFWGRGVCEKGYNSQKALDTELRARIDALSLTIHPMMAIDATRLDSAGIAGQVNGEATAAGISMSLGAIIKRHKRTLINFQQSFLIPFVKKAAYRYMQFDPENYPVADYKFNASSTLGIIAREYEVTQLVQLLQTMGQESPLYPTLVQSIIDNMNLSNREELIAAMTQALQPNPQAQEAQMAVQQAQVEFQQSQTNALNAQAQESNARATKLAAEAAVVPQELEIDRINAITRNLKEGDQDDKEFERRMRVAETLLREREVAAKEQGNVQVEQRANETREAEQMLMQRLGQE
jgi:hypothetical protein